MINKKLNSRLDITLPNSQFQWITKNAAKLGISKSKFICWILAKRINQIINDLKVYDAPTQEIRNDMIEKEIEIADDISDSEIDALIKRASKPKDKRI